jgi:hypothetical protein
MAMILAFGFVASDPIFFLIMICVAALWFLLLNAVGNYGKSTALGYWGTILLAVLSTPITAFIIVAILKWRNPAISKAAPSQV